MRKRMRAALAASCLVLAAGCATNTLLPNIPPVTAEPSQTFTPGRFVWVDLITQQAEEAKAFYGALFGWTFDTRGRYTRVLHEGTPIGGIVAASDPAFGSDWIGNLSVVDVDRSVAFVAARGGMIEREPIDAPGRGRMALIRDPQGAHVLLLRSATGDPPDVRNPSVGDWLWGELWTRDPEQAAGFYSALAGYEVEVAEVEGRPYRVLRLGDVPRAGVVEAPPDVDPLWVPYVRVADTGATAARAKELGGRVAMQSAAAAILVDPTGAAIGIQTWSGEPADGERP